MTLMISYFLNLIFRNLLKLTSKLQRPKYENRLKFLLKKKINVNINT